MIYSSLAPLEVAEQILKHKQCRYKDGALKMYPPLHIVKLIGPHHEVLLDSGRCVQSLKALS